MSSTLVGFSIARCTTLNAEASSLHANKGEKKHQLKVLSKPHEKCALQVLVLQLQYEQLVLLRLRHLMHCTEKYISAKKFWYSRIRGGFRNFSVRLWCRSFKAFIGEFLMCFYALLPCFVPVSAFQKDRDRNVLVYRVFLFESAVQCCISTFLFQSFRVQSLLLFLVVFPLFFCFSM